MDERDELGAMEERMAREERLGFVLSNHPVAMQFAHGQVAACAKYLESRALLLPDTPLSSMFEAIACYHATAASLASGFAGRPLDAEFVASVHRGDAGSLREKLSHVYRFFSCIFERDMVGAEALSSQTRDALLQHAGFDIAALDDSLRLHAISGGLWHQALWLPEHRVKDARVPRLPPSSAASDGTTAGLPLPSSAPSNGTAACIPLDAWSTMTRAEFTASRGVLSPTEEQLTSPLGAAYVPWVAGERLHTVDEGHPWAAAARAAGWPLRTAISSSASQYQVR